jgi:cobalt-zinc-cadmium efflux system outer membrane protein
MILAVAPSNLLAQNSAGATLDSLVKTAVAHNPAIRAAGERIVAARARISAAGARPDPTLMLGVVNLPVRNPSFTADDMTMKMIGVEQVLPYRGKLGLRTQMARRDLEVAAATSDSVRLATIRELKTAYYELAFADQAIAIAERSHDILNDIVTVAQGRYAAGRGTQTEVLRASLEATRLNETVNALRLERATALATLNALLDRPSDTRVQSPTIDQRIAAAAVAQPPNNVRFISQALGSSAADSPLPPLAELQEIAVRSSPVLRASAAMIDAKTAEVELVRKEFLPDIALSLQYGQRSGSTTTSHGSSMPRADMISAVVSIPIPLQKGRNQDAIVSATNSELQALQSERAALTNSVRAQVVRLYADIEHNRTQLALYVKAILPQGRATLTSATGNYQSGDGDLIPVLGAQETIFDYETGYYRALTDFAKKIAELEALVGKEVIP